MFDFNKAYRVLINDHQGQHLLGIAMGIRPFTAPFPPPYDEYGTGHGFEWVPNSPVWPSRRVFLDVLSDTPDRVEAKEKMAEFNGNDVTYVFEPLTVEKLAEVRDDISGFDTFVSDLASDEDIQEFYLDTWLKPRKDWQPSSTSEEVEPDGLDQIEEEIEEGLAYPVGTKRDRADGYVWMKMPNKKWYRLKKTLDPLPDPDEEDDELEAAPIVRTLPPGGGPWIDHAEGVPTSTFLEHFEEDTSDPLLAGADQWERMRPKPERQRLHNVIMRRIRHEIMRGRPRVPADQTPVAILTMGVPASGKTTSVKATVALDEFVHIDQDRIKEYIPEYQKAVAQRAKNAASATQDESAWLADQLRDEAIDRRMNFVFEGVGRDPMYYADLVAHLKESGYRVQIVFPHIENVDTAVAGSIQRGEDSGRWVDERYIRRVHPVIPPNFMALKDAVDDFFVFDGENRPYALAWMRKDGEETVVDPTVKDRLQDKADPELSRRVAKEIEQARMDELARLSEPLGLQRASGPDTAPTEPIVRRVEAKEARPSKPEPVRPPFVSADEVLRRFIKAYELDHVAYEMLPKKRQFSRDQGTVEMPDDPHRRRARFRR